MHTDTLELSPTALSYSNKACQQLVHTAGTNEALSVKQPEEALPRKDYVNPVSRILQPSRSDHVASPLSAAVLSKYRLQYSKSIPKGLKYMYIQK